MPRGTEEGVMTGERESDSTRSRWISKKDANRIAAARVYIRAMEKAGRDVPDSVKRLAQGIL